VQVGDLVKFWGGEKEENDIGIITRIRGKKVMILWAKTGKDVTTIDTLVSRPHYFEVISTQNKLKKA